jgi:hypothetical protein
MFRRLEAAMLQGIALASLGIGCSGTVNTTSPDGDGGTTNTGGTTSTTGGTGTSTGGLNTGGAPATGGVVSTGGGDGTGGSSPLDPDQLPPLPTDREFPHQVGDDHGDGPGYYGFCTGEVHCAEVVDGLCPSLDNSSDVPGYPPGSGSCSCTGGEIESFQEGPFRRDPERAPASEPGPCCYVFYGIGCDGRPLCAEGRLILADVVVRSDWGARRFRRS